MKGCEIMDFKELTKEQQELALYMARDRIDFALNDQDHDEPENVRQAMAQELAEERTYTISYDDNGNEKLNYNIFD